jgi:hypothetical protein
MRAMPHTSFRLQGEPNVFEPGRAIRILANHALEVAPDSCFDLAVNMDSLPEIAPPIATGICTTIRRVARHFLSVNQEAMAPRTATDRQGRVCDLVSRVGGFKRVSRAPFWMREGFVEELYRLDIQ